MNEHELELQAELHRMIETVALDDEDGDEPRVVVGWIVVYETATLGNASASAGHIYGPREMTTWRALGLIEWARRFGLVPDDDDEDTR